MDKEFTRLDHYLVASNMADSRNKAQQMIAKGYVTINGSICTKPSKKVNKNDQIRLIDKLKYVSRAGYKLESLLNEYKIDVLGQVACDIGSSTGGFVDCLLQNGARKVYAVDVNTEQLHPKLIADPRVFRIKKNARELQVTDLQEKPGLVTIDVSFISVTKLVKPVKLLTKPASKVIILIKPQFEVGKVHKGIIRDKQLHVESITKVLNIFQEETFTLEYLTYSKILGSDGNIEFFAVFSRNCFSNSFRKIELSDIMRVIDTAWEVLQ
ncbi:MAG TPA: TlyA family RNA methyltransferase [Fervidobacterium sp.]|nr:TlyA family rRNA (cytidine-2'-O)-methyltransferase [Fervidobacterium sp.]HOK88097.1 TlyA family RNA methyltransferase [Fervidobacterium sp.]HOM74486.1 TlyA family RNA methyltransferase [Fervidobacterium sp.]HPP18097.1 TlyA family RNA methyltransferase [Fervidobacterium sp.]HPZ17107.1 TlyA family RNA methyltransferase [Fervidobacterium sp.]